MLDQELKYYEEHRDELFAKHEGQFVLIKGNELIGTFGTVEEALVEGARLFGAESFLVRHISEEAEKPVYIPALTLGIIHAVSK